MFLLDFHVLLDLHKIRGYSIYLFIFPFFENVGLFLNHPAQLILLVNVSLFGKLGFQTLCTTRITWVNIGYLTFHEFLWLLSQLFLGVWAFAY